MTIRPDLQLCKNFLGVMLKPNKPRVSALVGHLPEKRYLWSFYAGKSVFKNKMIVSLIVLIVLIYCLFSGSAKIKDKSLMQNFLSLF